MLGLPGFAAIVLIGALLYAALLLLHKRSRLVHDWHRDLLAIGTLVVATIAFFWPLMVTESWIPKGGGDLASFLYPTYAFGARWIRRGVIPLWNPHLYLGMPFLADNQSGLFYPLHLIAFSILPKVTYEAVELMAVAHVLLAGLATYLLLRDLPSIRVVLPGRSANAQSAPRIARVPATAGAIAFMFSDLFVVHPGNLNIIATAAWLPLVVLCFRRGLTRCSPKWAAAAGVVLGTAALAGHAQMTLYLGLTIGLLAAYDAARRGRSWAERIYPIGLLALAGAVGFGAAALALIPTLNLTAYTVRASMSYADAAAYSVPPAGLVGILMPGFFGRGTGPFWGPWPRTEMGYAGILPLLFAGVALALTWQRSRIVRFWVLLGLLGLLTALGPDTIVHGLSYAILVPFRQLRVPARAIVLFDFSVAMLAGQGLDSLLQPQSRRARSTLRQLRVGLTRITAALAVIGLPVLGHAVLSSRLQVPDDVLSQHVASMGSAIVFLLLLAAGLAIFLLRERKGLPREQLGILATAVIALDLLSLGAYVEVEPNDPLVGYQHEEAIAFLRDDPELFRVETTPEIHGSWAPDWALLYEMDDLNGIWNPLRLGAYDVLTWVGIQRGDPFYDLYNVKYVITSRDTPVPAHFELAFDEGEQLIYRNPRYLPRAFLVYDVVSAGGDISALNKARSEGFDARRQIVLKAEEVRLATSGTSSPTERGRVAIIDRGPNHVAFEVSTASAGYLFVSEMWMPGWRSYVDGEAQPVLQANYTFRAVPVPPGDHSIEMVYRPASWYVGVSITLGTVVGLIMWSGWSLWRRLRNRGPELRAPDA